MKPVKILLTITAFSLTFMLINSCGKKKSNPEDEDTSKPVITLKGDANMTVSKGATVADPGATAIDDSDGDISSQVTSNWAEKVKFSETGTYDVTYSVSDKKGNQATATRIVTVKNGSGSMLGEWNSQYANPSSSTGIFTSTISAGDNTNQIVVYPFGVGNIYMRMNMGGIFGNDLSYSQTDFGITSTGTGTITNGGKTILLAFTYGGGSGVPMTATLTLK